MKYELIWR